jgi:two-component system, OmpR family, response regulator RegX3
MGTRIVVVEDDVFAAKVIKFVLESQGYEVAWISRANQVVEQVVGRETDLVLLDVNLPDSDGFRLCSELRARRYRGPVIFLTGQIDIASKVEGFQVGADDYVIKPYEPAELIVRIESVIRRYKSTDQQALGTIVRVGDAELSISNQKYSSAAIPPTILAPTEMRLLECLMRNSHIVMSRETLIERTWGYDYVGDSNRVDVYVRRLRNKIELKPHEPNYLHTVRGLGYVFRAATSSSVVAEPLHDSLSTAAL